MSPSSWLDINPVTPKDGVIAATLVVVAGALIWLVDRWLDVRANRQWWKRYKRDQIARTVGATPPAQPGRVGTGVSIGHDAKAPLSNSPLSDDVRHPR